MTDTSRSGDLVEQEAIAWANKVKKASGTSYTTASRNAAAFILQTATALEQVRKDALEPVLEQARDIVTNHRAWIAKHPNRAAECLESALGTLDLLVAHYNLKDQANG